MLAENLFKTEPLCRQLLVPVLVHEQMDINGGALNQFGMKKLTNNNYQYWRMCMKAYL